MLLSEKLIQNTADQYILRLSGFDLARLSEFDAEYQEMRESVFFHLCSLGDVRDFSTNEFAEAIVPAEKLDELRNKIDFHYYDMDQKARTTFWSIVTLMIWQDSHKNLCDIEYEKRYKDPVLGDFFKKIDEVFKRMKI